MLKQHYITGDILILTEDTSESSLRGSQLGFDRAEAGGMCAKTKSPNS